MWPEPKFPADLVTFTEEIRNGKLDFCAVWGLINDLWIDINKCCDDKLSFFLTLEFLFAFLSFDGDVPNKVVLCPEIVLNVFEHSPWQLPFSWS